MKTMKIIKIFSLALILAVCSTLVAQTPTGFTFGAYGGAMGVHVGGKTNIGSITVQTLSVTPSFTVEATQLFSPGANLSGYYGGISYALPFDFSKNTLLPSKTFQLAVHGSGGVVSNTFIADADDPGLIKPGSHGSAFGGVQLNIAPTSDGKFVFGPRVDMLFAPGFGGSNFGYDYSVSIAYLFGGTKSSTVVPASYARKVWGTKTN